MWAFNISKHPRRENRGIFEKSTVWVCDQSSMFVNSMSFITSYSAISAGFQDLGDTLNTLAVCLMEIGIDQPDLDTWRNRELRDIPQWVAEMAE